MGDKLEIVQSSDRAGVQLLAVSGMLDWHHAQQLLNQLKPLMKSKSATIVVDLTQVAGMDSAGVAVLVEGARWGASPACRFVLRGVGREVHDQFELAKVEQLFEIESY
ncbi:MAG: STAS domain-containing protein [Zetaproteobacteria bacterium]|nr:STAS domain-containing protein [Zetaproteobacteria bacterium]